MEAIVEIVKQVPALGVLAYLVWMNNKATISRDKAWIEQLERRDAGLLTIGDQCHEVQRDSIDAMNENTRVLGKVELVLVRMNGER